VQLTACLPQENPALKKQWTYALVVEGGGMRGGFSAGVLDVFLENDFDPFSIYGGTSGGAMNLSSYLSRQHGRNFRIYRDICTDKQFISFGKYLRGGHWLDLDWLWWQMASSEPFDVHRAMQAVQGKQLYFATTRVDTGGAEYLSPSASSWMDCLKASAALPVLYRDFIELSGVSYTDGGVSDPLPFAHAARLGADVIVVIRSRPSAYRMRSNWGGCFAAAKYRKHAGLKSSLLQHATIYNYQAETIQKRSQTGSLISIAPDESTAAGRTLVTHSSIEGDYQSGRTAGKRFLENMQMELR
jgi:predicted patatin/cPLA2 family phospholipase